MSLHLRSLHFVPGASDKMLARSLASEADALVLDLEDAVTPDNKDSAREVVAGWLADADFGAQLATVRINPLDTPWGRADLAATMVHPPAAYVVPKIQGPADVRELNAIITNLEEQHGHPVGGVKLILIATETPRGALNIADVACVSRVGALSWGAEDLSAAIGAQRTRDADGNYLAVFAHCRTMTLLSATAADVQPIDTVYVDIRDHKGLEADCRYAAWMGFTGKITIHPDQIPVVNAAFTPSADEIAEAQELLAAFAENQAAGRMAFAFRGQMVDVPHLTRARKLLARAGISVDAR